MANEVTNDTQGRPHAPRSYILDYYYPQELEIFTLKFCSEAHQGNSPRSLAAHTTLLSHHLNKIKQNDQIGMLKNNYLRVDPNAPPKRGRGCPPKPKKAIKTKTTIPPPLGVKRGRDRPLKV
ncbi:hypothetical protein Goarm_020411 [Gossypium armourianum]|uniref:Uncharacterized protein n=1 Tax=Gossypium armourianum TaxID=34283 RepID=A0A7J9INI2_9ROSI|nr:hypothetical protein [Gossypium armourianum]